MDSTRPVFLFRNKFDSRRANLIFRIKLMADIPPTNPLPGTPTGAEPMKKSTGRVQPKKETVRINLPPKPSAAPTIKLPTLPPGGPSAGPAPAAPAPAVGTAAPHAPAPRVGAAAPSTAPRPASTAPRPAPAAIASAPTVSMFDKILAVVAAIAGLAAAGSAAYLIWGLP